MFEQMLFLVRRYFTWSSVRYAVRCERAEAQSLIEAGDRFSSVSRRHWHNNTEARQSSLHLLHLLVNGALRRHGYGWVDIDQCIASAAAAVPQATFTIRAHAAEPITISRIFFAKVFCDRFMPFCLKTA